MRKLVIGCGYLGNRVARKWQEAGDEVFALTRSDETAERFRAQGIQPIVGDVTKPDTLKSLPDVETVLYAVGFDRSSGLSQREIYVGGLQNVVDEMEGRASRFLYVSSTSVYGQNQGEWIDENSSAEPSSESGKICRDAERLVEQKFAMAQATILRLAGIYGPGRLFRRIAEMKAGKPLGGDPESWLNLIHVEDAVQTVLACEKQNQPADMYLVSDDHPVRRREYYAKLAELIGTPLPAFDRGAEPRHAVGLGKRCLNRRVREELGVELQFPSFLEGLPSAIEADLDR